jgi:hypothetical protein
LDAVISIHLCSKRLGERKQFIHSLLQSLYLQLHFRRTRAGVGPILCTERNCSGLSLLDQLADLQPAAHEPARNHTQIGAKHQNPPKTPNSRLPSRTPPGADSTRPAGTVELPHAQCRPAPQTKPRSLTRIILSQQRLGHSEPRSARNMSCNQSRLSTLDPEIEFESSRTLRSSLSWFPYNFLL